MAQSTRSLSTLGTALRAQRVAVVSILTVGLVVAFTAAWKIPMKYTATATVLMVAEPPESQNRLLTSTATKPLLSADLPALALSDTVLSRFRNDLRENLSFENLRARVRARVSLDSNVMPVQFTDRDAHTAVAGANALADEITTSYREIATKRFDSLITDLSGQIARRRRELTKLDTRLQSEAKRYPYIDVSYASSGSPNSVYQRLIALRTERDSAAAAMSADASAALRTGELIRNAKPLAMHSVVENDAMYRSLRDQYIKDAAQLRHLESFANETYPGMTELRNTVAREAASVQAARNRATSTGPAADPAFVAALDAQTRANAQLAADQARVGTIQSEIDQLQSSLGNGSVATTVAQLRRDRDNVAVTYATLSERLAKTVADRAEAGSTGSVIVMDRAAYARRALWTSGPVIGAAILVFAIWLAITVALALEGSRPRFRDSKTIETVYGAPLLGSVI